MTSQASEMPATHHEPALGRDRRLEILPQILCVVVPVAVWFAPLNLAPQTQHGLAIAAFMVVAWMTQAMEFALAGLIGCFLFWALGIVRFPVAFSGFANDTAWFLFAAMIFGRIASKSGLARRLAYSIMLRAGVTYSRILFGMILTDFFSLSSFRPASHASSFLRQSRSHWSKPSAPKKGATSRAACS